MVIDPERLDIMHPIQQLITFLTLELVDLIIFRNRCLKGYVLSVYEYSVEQLSRDGSQLSVSYELKKHHDSPFLISRTQSQIDASYWLGLIFEKLAVLWSALIYFLIYGVISLLQLIRIDPPAVRLKLMMMGKVVASIELSGLQVYVVASNGAKESSTRLFDLHIMGNLDCKAANMHLKVADVDLTVSMSCRVCSSWRQLWECFESREMLWSTHHARVHITSSILRFSPICEQLSEYVALKIIAEDVLSSASGTAALTRKKRAGGALHSQNSLPIDIFMGSLDILVIGIGSLTFTGLQIQPSDGVTVGDPRADLLRVWDGKRWDSYCIAVRQCKCRALLSPRFHNVHSSQPDAAISPDTEQYYDIGELQHMHVLIYSYTSVAVDCKRSESVGLHSVYKPLLVDAYVETMTMQEVLQSYPQLITYRMAQLATAIHMATSWTLLKNVLERFKIISFHVKEVICQKGDHFSCR